MGDFFWPMTAVVALAVFCAVFPWAAARSETPGRTTESREAVRPASAAELRRQQEEYDALYGRQLIAFLDPTAPGYLEDRHRLTLQEPSIAAELPPLDEDYPD